jgi:hypothetical protein
MNNISLKIGNIKITFYSKQQTWLSLIEKNYHNFVSKTVSNCKVYISNDKPANKLSAPLVKTTNHKIDVLRNDFISSSEIGLNSTTLSILKNKYSFDSWLRIYFTLIALKNSGFLLHSSGIALNRSKAYVFPGISGQGKSTIIKILGKPAALSDELVYVYKKNKVFRTSSTPFWGELKKGNAGIFDAKLGKICFINHGKNSIERISVNKAVKKLLRTVLFFSKKPADIQKLLFLLSDTAFVVPAYDLYFSLDSTKNDIITLLKNGDKHGN